MREIERSMVTGELKPGDRLPTEHELARQLGVSRTSVREALRTLEAMGFIDSRPGGGTRIRELTLDNLLGFFKTLLARQQDLVRRIFETRLLLEPQVARLAAQRANPHDLQRLQAILSEHERRITSGEPATREDLSFHAAVAAATHNDVLSQIVDLLVGLLHEWRLIAGETRPARSVLGHRSVTEAIARGDPQDAEQAMRDHLQTIVGSVRVLPRQQARTTSPGRIAARPSSRRSRSPLPAPDSPPD